MMIEPFAIYLDDDRQKNLTSEISGIIARGRYILGKHTERLEDLVCNQTGFSYAKTLSSGTVALEVLFEYLAAAGHRSVAVQSNTNFATVSSAVRAGLKVIFIDCDGFGQISSGDLIDKYQRYKFDLCAIVHIGGFFSNNLTEILRFATLEKIKVIEDCAHAHGTVTKFGPAGGLGYASIFSYFPTKLVNGGEGGILCTNDQQLSDFTHKWRNQGKGGVYGNDHTVLGGSYRMPEINCAIALSYYEVLEEEKNRREKMFRYLKENTIGVKFNDLENSCEASFYKVICSIEQLTGAEVEQKLLDFSIKAGGAVYRTPCHMQPVFKNITKGTESLSGTDAFCSSHFCPPVHSKITDSDLDYMVSALRQIAG